MPRIVWSDELEIGIGVIDGQHRRIVDYINTLHEVGEHPDRSVVRGVIDDLVDYTFSHFAFEEALMEEAGYDALAIHRNTHRAFCERIEDLKLRFASGEDVAAELGELLQTWLVNHIMSDDESYADLVKEKMPRIERKERGNWLGETVRRFFAH